MRNFPDQFAAAVDRFPDRPAVSVRGEGGVQRFTYRELDAMRAGTTAWLRREGIRVGDRCALLAENSAQWCAAYLGMLQLGAVAVPFDTNYNEEQVEKLLRDSGARLVVASPRFEATARAAAEAAGCLAAKLEDVTAAGVVESEESDPHCSAVPDDPAVILYTSGTTADPKGVVLTHGNLLAEKTAAFQVVHVDERDTVLGVLPLFHSLAQMANLLLPLSMGAHVVFLETLGTRELLRAFELDGVSVFACVPQFYYLIHKRVLDEVARAGVGTRVAFRVLRRLNGWLRAVGVNAGPLLFARVHRTLGPRMRVLVTGGSKFDPVIGRDLQNLGLTILQAYGLTETSGAATLMRPWDPIGTVGRALPGVEIRIAVPADPTVPRDATAASPDDAPTDGEVLIRGPIVMRGYWRRPDATAEVLIDGWLRTGDLGRLDAAGRLTITGRCKEMIVLESGKNIYPEEIEAHYRQSQFIKELCVLGVSTPDAPASERLHAVVVPDLDVLRERGIVNTVELMRFEMEGLSVALPAHKRVLGFTVSMEPLERTTTGKLKRHEILRGWTTAAKGESAGDRRAARDGGTGGDRADDDPSDVAPHVRRVVAAVRELTRADVDVGPESNFELDLGLDSMERVELQAALEQRFGVRVPREVAQSAFLVRDLAEAFRNATDDATGAARADVAPAWDTLMAQVEPGPELQAILRDRPMTAVLLSCTLRLLGGLLFRPSVTGIEHLPAQGAFIISPNHQSYVDPFVLSSVLPLGIFGRIFSVGAAEYFETRLTRAAAAQLNVVPVDPDTNLLPAMQAAAYGLQHGRVLILFPEGERSIDGQVKKFRKGAAILSRHVGVPIVPVAIDGLFDVWPRTRRLAWRKLLPWSGHRIRLQIGAPLSPADGETYEATTERLREVVERMMGAGHDQS